MNEREAAEILGDAELVPIHQGTLSDIKRIRAECLAADVPVAVAPPACSTCGTKLALLVREEDVPRVGELLRREWAAALEREGTARSGPVNVQVAEGAELPCPACGTAAPLVAGACSDCGLQLD